MICMKIALRGMNTMSESMSVNEQVKEMRMKQIEDEITLFELKTLISDMDTDKLNAISAELNELGKPLFSNETKREIELKIRLKGNTEYQSLIIERKALEKQIKVNAVKIDFLIFEMKLSMSDKSTSDAIDRLTTQLVRGIRIQE